MKNARQLLREWLEEHPDPFTIAEASRAIG